MIDSATKEFLSWARYLFWAELMHRDWDRYMSEKGSDDAVPEWLAVTCYWGASLYVVVEGWELLKLTDPIIEALLNRQTSKDMLRRLRNGTFHYQSSLTSPKMTDFLGSDPNATLWLVTLHDEFCRFFRQWVDRFQGTPAELAEVRDYIVGIVGWIPPTPAEPEIKTLRQLQAQDEGILARNDACRQTRNALESAMKSGEDAIKESRELAHRSRFERLWKLGVLAGPTDAQ